MNVLMVAWETPLPANSGSRLRMLHLARQLSGVEHLEVHALGDVPSAADEPFELHGVTHDRSRIGALLTSWRRPYMAGRFANPRIAQLAMSRPWDIVQVESPWLVNQVGKSGAPTILDTHNVESAIARTLADTDMRRVHRMRWKWEAAKTDRAEAAAVRAADVVVACSDDDAAALEKLGARRTLVVPNGIDTAALAHGWPASEPVLLYVGHFGYRPNEAAAIELVDLVLPRVRESVPDARVHLVGRQPSAQLLRRASEAVRVFGDVPDVTEHLRQARVVVVPLRAGSGTRLKVLEAMAAGIPVVTTSLGGAGIAFEPGRHALVGESCDELADLTARVLVDDELARDLSLEGRRLVEEHYDWSVVARPLLALHAELAGCR